MRPVYSLCSSDVKQCPLSCWSCVLIQILRVCATGKINTLFQWVKEYKPDSFHRKASSNPWKSHRFSQFSPKMSQNVNSSFLTTACMRCCSYPCSIASNITLLLVHMVKFLDKCVDSGWSLLPSTTFFFPFTICHTCCQKSNYRRSLLSILVLHHGENCSCATVVMHQVYHIVFSWHTVIKK